MNLQEKTQNDSCNFQQEFQLLLSQRMDALNQAPIKVKSLLSLHDVTPTHNPLNMQTMPLSNANNSKENFVVTNLKNPQYFNEKSKMKVSHLKRTSAAKKQRYSFMEDVRLFQIGESNNGRRPVLTQVKNMRVSEFTGRGLLILPNGKKYQGQWIDGNLIGEAKVTYPNGDIYLGGIYNYEKHGKGYMYFNSGEKYVGEFSSGDFHGEGVFYDKEGIVKYDGEWRRGKMINE